MATFSTVFPSSFGSTFPARPLLFAGRDRWQRVWDGLVEDDCLNYGRRVHMLPALHNGVVVAADQVDIGRFCHLKVRRNEFCWHYCVRTWLMP